MCQVLTINYRLPVAEGTLTSGIFPGVTQKVFAKDRILEVLKRGL